MSFNSNDIINLGNYEEYFILYMDDELNAEQKRMVEDFLQKNPQLQSELDILLSTKLPVEEITFANKEDLMSSQMKSETVDENLLLYLDNELNTEERSRVETQLQSDAAYLLQYNSLLQTRLDPSDVIAYPNKKELYRHSGGIISFTTWMRIAAAIILIATAAILFVFYPSKNVHNNSVATTTTDPIKKQTVTLPTVTNTQNESTIAQQTATKNNTPTTGVEHTTVVNNPTTDHQVATVENTPEIQKVIKVQPIEVAPNNNIIAFNTSPDQTISTTPVTNQPPVAYNNSEAVAVNQNPEVSNADDEPRSRGSIKGFLRKAARNIERRTGIGTANSDNELYIGAVAVKL